MRARPYTTDEEYFDDLCAIFRQEIADLAALGCRYVQLDEVPLIMLGSETIRQQTRDLGGDPDHFLNLYIDAMNAAVRDRGDVVAAMHMCRGNFKGKWLMEGGYDDIAEQVFKRVDVDAFMLEYDTDRAGTFEPLAHVPDDKMVVLGLVSSKVPELEQAEYLEKTHRGSRAIYQPRPARPLAAMRLRLHGLPAIRWSWSTRKPSSPILSASPSQSGAAPEAHLIS